MGRWVLVSAGEASGDLHAAQLVQAMKEYSPQLRFFGLGGPKLADVGVQILDDVTSYASIGPFEGLTSYFRIMKVFFRLLREAKNREPVAAVLVDYPEFNMRLGLRLKSQDVPVFYYIVPQVWAWRSHRVETLSRFVHTALCVLPFEERWLRRRGVNARFVGHPLLDVVPDTKEMKPSKKFFGLPDQPLVALLPGSRIHEVKRMLPIMVEAAKRLRSLLPVSFCVSRAPSVPKALFSCSPFPLTEETYNLLAAADCAVVTSGTATLEAALLLCPPVVVYRVSTPTFLLLHHLLHVRFYALCNIAAGEPLAPELIQYNATPERIVRAVLFLLDEEERRRRIEVLKRLRFYLGGKGTAKRAAKVILSSVEGM